MKQFFIIVIAFLIFTNIGFAALHFSVMTTELGDDTATVSIPFTFESSEFQVSSAPLHIRVEVFDEENNPIQQKTESQFVSTQSKALGTLSIPIKQPKRWSTESPYLYQAKLSVLKQDQIVESGACRFGIRLLEIDGNVWEMNGLPLKLKGVVYRYHPEFWQRDLLSMQQAHINAIRVDGVYPPEAFLAACDVMGMQVITQPPTNMNAKPLVSSHPSIMAWEMPESAQIEMEFSKIQAVDPSRVVISADQLERSITNGELNTPLSLHPQEWLQRKSKPLVLLAEPAIDGNRMEGIEEAAAVMNAADHFAGFFIHCFADDHEGLVSSKRALTANYTEAQKVLSPIQIDQDEVEIKPGDNSIELDVHNRFQQINVSETTCQWVLFEDQKAVQNGSMYLNIPPQQSFEMEIDCTLPDDVDRHFYFLRINFFVGDQLFHSHVVRLLPKKWEEKLLLRLDDLEMDKEWTVDTSVEGSDFLHEGFVFRDRTPEAGWFLMTQDGHVRLIMEGPFVLRDEEARMISQSDIHNATPPDHIRDWWILERDVNRRDRNIVAESSLLNRYIASGHRFDITTLFSPFGFMDVKYELHFDFYNPPPIFGLAFRLSPTLNRFQYVGKGSYPAYPGKRALNDYGIFSFVDWENFVPGNREDVMVAAFTGKHGYGLGIMMLDGNLSVLPSEAGALVSINAVVAGLGNKNWDTQYPINREQALRDGYGAAFRLIPLTKNQYPELFEATFKN